MGQDRGVPVRRLVPVQAWRPVRHRAEGRQLAQQEKQENAGGVIIGGANDGAGRVQEETGRGQKSAECDARVGLR